MKVKIIVIALVVTLVALPIVLFLGFFRWMSEVESQVYSSYPTLREAAEAGAIGEYKLLPPFIPPSTENIRNMYWIDTSEEWLSFSFTPEDINDIRSNCSRITDGEIKLPDTPPLNIIIWPPENVDWPDELTADNTSVRIEDITSYEFYRCKQGKIEIQLAVEPNKGNAYSWEHEKPGDNNIKGIEYPLINSSFPTYQAAADANAIGAGGDLPSLIPFSASNIRYIKFMDGGPDMTMWLSFDFDIAEIHDIRRHCNRVIEGKVWPSPFMPPGSFLHWPREIIPEEVGGTFRAEDIPGYEFYRCEHGTEKESRLGIKTAILSVDIRNERAYYTGPQGSP